MDWRATNKMDQPRQHNHNDMFIPEHTGPIDRPHAEPDPPTDLVKVYDISAIIEHLLRSSPERVSAM